MPAANQRPNIDDEPAVPRKISLWGLFYLHPEIPLAHYAQELAMTSVAALVRMTVCETFRETREDMIDEARKGKAPVPRSPSPPPTVDRASHRDIWESLQVQAELRREKALVNLVFKTIQKEKAKENGKHDTKAPPVVASSSGSKPSPAKAEATAAASGGIPRRRPPPSWPHSDPYIRWK